MSGKKIKVALCLSGEPRSSMFCFPYIYESFINLEPQYEVDVYIHTWRGFRALPLYNPKNFNIETQDDEEFYNNIINNLYKNSTSPTFFSFWKNTKSFTVNSSPLKNSFLMYKSLSECFNLIKEPYDVYIRSRIDIFFPENFSGKYNYFHDIILSEVDLMVSPKLKVSTDKKDPPIKFLDDRLFMCNNRSVQVFKNLFNSIPNIINETDSLFPEIWLEHYINKHKLKYKYFFNAPSIARKTKVIMDYRRTPNFLDQ